MADININYLNPGTAIAITSADNLGSGAWCSSALVDNGINKYVDALFGGSIQLNATIGSAGSIDIYVAASWDGTEFTAGVDAGDGVITWNTTGNTHVNGEKDLFYVGSAQTAATDDGNDIVFGPFSVAQACGGVMPMEWCVVVENNTGAAFDATGTNNHLEYVGIEYTVA